MLPRHTGKSKTTRRIRSSSNLSLPRNDATDRDTLGRERSERKVLKPLKDRGIKSLIIRRHLNKLFPLYFLTVIIFTVAITLSVQTMCDERRSNQVIQTMINASKGLLRVRTIDVSIVILTHTKHKLLEKLLPSLLHQSATNFEVIIVDNGCVPETKRLFEAFRKGARRRNIPNRYLPLCNNESYFTANKMGAEITSKRSTWIMFLNDDIILEEEHFLLQMINIVDIKPNAGGAVCKLLTEDGKEIQEAGGIVWSDATVWSTGRGSKNVNAFDLSYPKPVDYGSGACFMVHKDIYNGYKGLGGLQGSHSSFEDVDLQMYVQHNAGKEVWYQPKAVAYHTGEGSLTRSVTGETSAEGKIFQEKWRSVVEHKHLANPSAYTSDKRERQLQLKKAIDLRARDPAKANILWLEEAAPNPDNGSGFGRAFDNLSMVSELGHRITVLLPNKSDDSWCNKECFDRITGLGVEVYDGDQGHWEQYARKFIQLYDIVYISRPAIFKRTYHQWQEIYRKHSFTLIYDCEALWYKRDQMLLSLVQSGDISDFPGGMDYLGLMGSGMDVELVNLEISHVEEVELNLIQMADTVLAVSDTEIEIISDALPRTEAWTIGHTMSIDESIVARGYFKRRNGILFVASFNNMMYYNGDAIWYFLTKVYPLVLMESKSRIPITIAGRMIPAELRGLVRKTKFLYDNVSFEDSVNDLNDLYDNARVVIAPHLYGSGIQYKVSEAFALGVPTVMSKFTANGFSIKSRDHVGCVGESVQAIKTCIVELHENEETWNMVRDRQLDFIRDTHNRKHIVEIWDNVIQTNLKRIRDKRKEGDTHKMEHSLLRGTLINEVTEPCPEGEKYYSLKYPDVDAAIKLYGRFDSMFAHYKETGMQEGRKYLCFFKGGNRSESLQG